MNYKNSQVYTGFESLNEILHKVVKKLGIDEGLSELTLKNIWSEIVGPRFKDKSKLVSVIKKKDCDILLIAVYSSAVSQELFLFKNNILKKIEPAAISLQFNIKDIIFSTKLWEDVQEREVFNEKEENTTEIFVKTPTESELKNISVPKDVIDLIKDSIKEQLFSSPELKDRMLNMIIKDIKTHQWRKNNGFPVCSACGITVNYFNKTERILCPSCRFLNK